MLSDERKDEERKCPVEPTPVATKVRLCQDSHALNIQFQSINKNIERLCYNLLFSSNVPMTWIISLYAINTNCIKLQFVSMATKNKTQLLIQQYLSK